MAINRGRRTGERANPSPKSLNLCLSGTGGEQRPGSGGHEKGKSNLGLLCVMPVASEWSDLQEKWRRTCSERRALLLRRKQPRYQALASHHFQIVTVFFKFLFRSDQEQTHSTDTQTLTFFTCYPLHTHRHLSRACPNGIPR